MNWRKKNSKDNQWRKIALGLGILFAGRAIYRKLTGCSFKDKVVLITGSSRGLGLILARQLAKEGAKIVLCGRDKITLERARRQLIKITSEICVFTCDVTDQKQVIEMIASVRYAFGQIDVLINNAGIIQVGPAELMTKEDYEESLKTYFWAPWYTMTEVLPEMQERKEGRIVNISSIGGIISVPHLTPYCAGKFALAGLSEGLHSTYKKYGIHITSVYPGLMRTGSFHNVDLKGQNKEEFKWFSISSSLPGITVGAEHAARQIINACRHGDAELTITLPAKLIRILHGLAPGLILTLTQLADRLLPATDGQNRVAVKGYESYSDVSPSLWTKLGDEAARKNNELKDVE